MGGLISAVIDELIGWLSNLVGWWLIDWLIHWITIPPLYDWMFLFRVWKMAALVSRERNRKTANGVEWAISVKWKRRSAGWRLVSNTTSPRRYSSMVSSNLRALIHRSPRRPLDPLLIRPPGVERVRNSPPRVSLANANHVHKKKKPQIKSINKIK